MKNIIARIFMVLSFWGGFFASFSVVRANSIAFDWYAGHVYGSRLRWPIYLSLVAFIFCTIVFVLSIWMSKPLTNRTWLYRRVDYFCILLTCMFACAAIFFTMHPRIFNVFVGSSGLFSWIVTTQLLIIILPFLTYLFAFIALGELVARIRDKQLMSSLYLVQFFKKFPVWSGFGFTMLVFVLSQCILLIAGFFTIARIFSLLAIYLLTYVIYRITNLSKQFELANQEKIAAERFKSELITNVSHDIKTPLTSIINYVDLLKHEPLTSPSLDYVQVLERKSTRLKVLIDDLMDAAKAGTGNITINTERINFTELVGQIAGEFEDDFTEKQLSLVLKIPAAPVLMHTDPRHLYRIIENLFSNAAKYAMPGTRVFVDVNGDAHNAFFVMKNTSENHLDLTDTDFT